MSQNSRHIIFIITVTIVIFFTGFYFCLNNVNAAASSTITLSHTSKSLEIGDQMYLCAYSDSSAAPAFKSSNKKIATVNSAGKITAKSAGTAKITATISGKSASCTIRVCPTKIDLSAKSVSVECKGSYRLRATASNYASVTWKSKNPGIATVSSNGVVTGKKPGKATITASVNGTTAYCTVTVKKPILKLSSTTVTLSQNQALRLVATSSSSLKPVWSSNNKQVASVSENGTIRALKKGTAIITAKADGVKSTCVVTVK